MPKRDKSGWPLTVREAMAQLFDVWDDESIAILREYRYEELGALQNTLGMGIRNNFGLWQGNTALLTDCQRVMETDTVPHADDVTLFIIEQCWYVLQDEG